MPNTILMKPKWPIIQFSHNPTSEIGKQIEILIRNWNRGFIQQSNTENPSDQSQEQLKLKTHQKNWTKKRENGTFRITRFQQRETQIGNGQRKVKLCALLDKVLKAGSEGDEQPNFLCINLSKYKLVWTWLWKRIYFLIYLITTFFFSSTTHFLPSSWRFFFSTAPFADF